MKTTPDKPFDIHVTYTVSEGKHIAFVTNSPGCIVQADNLDEMKRKIKIVFKMWLDLHNEAFANDIFEYREVEPPDFHSR